MSDEARQCSVSPQELRNAAAYCNRMNPGLAHKLRAAADWLEKPASAFSSRCPHCDHAVHVGKCLQVLRVGKPGEDVFCLCPASEPTRGDEVACFTFPWTVSLSVDEEGDTIARFTDAPPNLHLMAHGKDAHEALTILTEIVKTYNEMLAEESASKAAPPTAQARPLTTRAQVLAAVNRYIVAIWSHETTEHEKAIDELMRDLGIEVAE